MTIKVPVTRFKWLNRLHEEPILKVFRVYLSVLVSEDRKAVDLVARALQDALRNLPEKASSRHRTLSLDNCLRTDRPCMVGPYVMPLADGKSN